MREEQQALCEVELDADVVASIQELVANGRFASSEDVIEAALKALDRRQEQEAVITALFPVEWSSEDQEFVGRYAPFPSLSYLADTEQAARSGIMLLVSETLKELSFKAIK